MVRIYQEVLAIQEVIKFLTANTMARFSLSNCVNFFSATDRVRDAKEIGFSVPSSISCDSTAPIP